jgi:hypothetical protein
MLQFLFSVPVTRACISSSQESDTKKVLETESSATKSYDLKIEITISIHNYVYIPFRQIHA